MKTRRRKLIRQDLEALLAKYERRIQRLAEEAYRVRQAIEQMQKEMINKPVIEEVKQIEGRNENV